MELVFFSFDQGCAVPGPVGGALVVTLRYWRPMEKCGKASSEASLAIELTVQFQKATALWPKPYRFRRENEVEQYDKTLARQAELNILRVLFRPISSTIQRIAREAFPLP